MRTLYPVLLGIASCAFVLNCSAQTPASTPGGDTENKTVQGSLSPGAEAPPVVDPSLRAAGELPESPSSTLLRLQDESGQSSSAQSSPEPAQSATNTPQDQKPQRPIGTAAAEAPKVSGITAAQPAGVAIAPAKQRRVRAIVLKVGAIVGAGAAVGTVIALTAATSSKPPGAH